MDSLRALGLEYNEGPDIGGPYAPYLQSERLPRYKEWAQKLIDSGRATPTPTAQQKFKPFREAAQKAKSRFCTVTTGRKIRRVGWLHAAAV